MGAILIFDELQSGLGRTGKMFAFQHYGIIPDILVIGKALGGGFPIGACLASGDAANVLSAGMHGSTFGGNYLSTTVGLCFLDFFHL